MPRAAETDRFVLPLHLRSGVTMPDTPINEEIVKPMTEELGPLLGLELARRNEKTDSVTIKKEWEEGDDVKITVEIP
jgi:hypothetical protein